jgi:PAS domain S-box-containing protein
MHKSGSDQGRFSAHRNQTAPHAGTLQQKTANPTLQETPQPEHRLDRKPLRVMIVEDSELDAQLVERQLRTAGYDVNVLRVDSAAAFVEALAAGDWDIIISDYAVPGFGAVPALELLKQSKWDIPFIIVSGAITDEIAVASMRAGAHDYVLKDKIARLVPAIEREMQEVVTRRQKLQAEEAVRNLSAIVESSDDAIIGKTLLDGTITSWNRGAEQLYGYTAAEVLGQSMSILLPPDRPDELVTVLQRLARGEHIAPYETVRRRKDGTLIDVAVKISPVIDAAGNIVGAAGIARDITERKRAEDALIRSEKLASVGRMAATVAHEINNPLAAVMNSIYIANSDPTLSPQTRDALQVADQELRRVAHIAAQTLVFCRETGIPTELQLPKIIDDVLGVYAKKLRDRGITVQQRQRCGPCGKKCDFCLAGNAGELRQVISNLLGNAMDALQDNGTLHVRLSRATSRDGSPKLRLTMADNGCGIRTENLKRVFEPFFTTKETVGTGLGLWVTEQIVQKYGGSIRMRSQARKGTVFSITLPATLPEGQPALKLGAPEFQSRTA